MESVGGASQAVRDDELLFVTYTIIQSIMRSEMCSLHLSHPSVAVGSRCCGARGTLWRPGKQ